MIICNANTRSEHNELSIDDIYFSPGLQIGYHFGSDFYFSYQLTTGLYIPEDVPFLPGITFGKRHYKYKKDKKYESFTYLDGQLVILFLGGAGFGKMWNSDGESFTKTKLRVMFLESVTLK